MQRLEDLVEVQRKRLVDKDEQIREQAELIQRLRRLPENRFQDLVRVARVEIEQLSGGYDSDRNGIDDGVVVYLRLYDQHGGTHRQSGSAAITLLDLANPDGTREVGRLRLTAAELTPLWAGRFLTSHYTIRVPWSESRRPAHKTITILATFTDLLTGQTFEAPRRDVVVRGAKAASLNPQPSLAEGGDQAGD